MRKFRFVGGLALGIGLLFLLGTGPVEVNIPLSGVYRMTAAPDGSLASTFALCDINNPANCVVLGQQLKAQSVPVTIASDQSNVPTNPTQINGATIDTNSGNKTSGTQRVVLANDQPTLNNPLSVQVQAQATGGCTPYHLSGGTGASTNSNNVKASAGVLCTISAINTTSTIYYLRMYDSASAPTCSSATGAVHSWPIPQATGAGAGFTIPIPTQGEQYNNGIGFCVTGGGGDTDNTTAAAGVYINASYK